MKRVGCLIPQFILGAGALVAALGALPAQAAEGTADVRSIRDGTAVYSEDGTTFKNLKVGDRLKAGATIKTDDRAVVDFFLNQNGPVIRVTPASTLALTVLRFEQAAEGETVIDTELNLSSGRILGAVKKLATASKYQVATPVGTCRIRGTEYDISANGRVVVTEGTVVVQYTPPGSTTIITHVVQVGQMFNPTANGGQGAVAPTPPAVLAQVQSEIKQVLAVAVTTPGQLAVVTVTAPPPPTKPSQQQPPGTKSNPGTSIESPPIMVPPPPIRHGQPPPSGK